MIEIDSVVILGEGARIAQHGTPTQLLASPADDFVASFIGADRGRRALTSRVVDGETVVFDGAGRAAGVLRQDETA